MKTKKKERIVNLALSEEEYERLSDLADREHRSLRGQIAYMLEREREREQRERSA